MDASSSVPPSASQGTGNGGAKVFKSHTHSGPKFRKSAWCLALFFMLIIGVNITSYWQTSGVEPRSLEKPVPVYPIRQWKDYHSAEVVSLGDGNDTSSPTSQILTKDRISSDIFSTNLTPTDSSSEPITVDSYNPTDPQNSFFMVKNADHLFLYTLCDTLELHIEARDRHNRVKQYGGDYFWIKVFSPNLEASQPADEIIDHQNGTYTARFTLHWTGTIHMQVLLIKTSEYIALLREQRQTAPARFAYDGKFALGSRMEIMPCHITKEMFLGSMEAARSRGFCDFSDTRMGYPWFCLKPMKLPCSSLVEHMGSLPRSHEYNELLLKGKPTSVIHKFANIRQTGSTTIEVKYGDTAEEIGICSDKLLPLCSPGLPPRPHKSAAGFYYQQFWQSLICQSRNFHTADALKCLQGRSLYFFGDSTLRQWFEYLAIHLGHTMREKRLPSSSTAGPRHSYDKTHDISLFFRHHGYPIRNLWTKVRDIKYAVNEIDKLPGGTNTVILLTFWAHFTPTNIQFYRDRWKSIKAALRRLQKRAPGTPVIIKSANTREQQGMDMSNWYAMELDKVMREELVGEPGIAIIDVWDMTLSHSTGYRIHPLEDVISQEIKMLLSFLCPVP